MTTCLIFTIPKPPSIWELYYKPKGKARWPKSHRYMTWLNDAGWYVKRLKPIDGPVDIVVSVARTITKKGAWSRKDGDIDNLAKPILDLLVEQQLIPDDSAEHVHGLELRWVDDKTIPQGKARVVIYPVGNKEVA